MKLRDAIFGTTISRRVVSLLLVVVALGVGFATGAFAADDSDDVTPGGAGSISLYSCPGGVVRSVARAGDRLAIEGRNADSDYVAVRDPRQPRVRLWAEAAQFVPQVNADSLDVLDCEQDGEPAEIALTVVVVDRQEGRLATQIAMAFPDEEWWRALTTTTTRAPDPPSTSEPAAQPAQPATTASSTTSPPSTARTTLPPTTPPPTTRPKTPPTTRSTTTRPTSTTRPATPTTIVVAQSGARTVWLTAGFAPTGRTCGTTLRVWGELREARAGDEVRVSIGNWTRTDSAADGSWSISAPSSIADTATSAMIAAYDRNGRLLASARRSLTPCGQTGTSVTSSTTPETTTTIVETTTTVTT